jgi:hypothetical protein
VLVRLVSGENFIKKTGVPPNLKSRKEEKTIAGADRKV